MRHSASAAGTEEAAVASTAAGAGVAFTVEAEAGGSMAVAAEAEGFTPVAGDIAGAALTGARVHLAAARDLLAEGVTTRAEAIVVDRRHVDTEPAGVRPAAPAPRAA